MLQSREDLIRYHEDSLQREFFFAKREEFLKRFIKERCDHCIDLLVLYIIVHACKSFFRLQIKENFRLFRKSVLVFYSIILNFYCIQIIPLRIYVLVVGIKLSSCFEYASKRSLIELLNNLIVSAHDLAYPYIPISVIFILLLHSRFLPLNSECKSLSFRSPFGLFFLTNGFHRDFSNIMCCIIHTISLSISITLYPRSLLPLLPKYPCFIAFWTIIFLFNIFTSLNFDYHSQSILFIVTRKSHLKTNHLFFFSNICHSEPPFP